MNGKLTALGCFLEKLVDKTFLFYKTLKQVLDKKDFRTSRDRIKET